MPQLQSSTLEAFRSLDEAGQRAALGRMSDEAKRTLLDQIRGVTAIQPAAPAPEPLPTKAFPMSMGEAFKATARDGIPGLIAATIGAPESVASRMSAEVISKPLSAIASIPGFIGQVGSTLWDNLKGVYGLDPEALTKGVKQSSELVSGVSSGVKEALTATPKAYLNTVRGLGALLSPEQIPAPSEQEQLETAGQAGMHGLTMATGGPLAFQVGSKVAKFIREAPVRKGYTTLDPVTLKPIPPEPPILVKHGLPAPEIPKGKIATYELPTQQIAEGLGLLDDVEGTVLKNAIAEIYPDLKYAQAHAEGVRGPVNTPAKARAVVDYNGERYWDIIEPEISQSGPMQNLATLSDDVQAQLPEHVKVFYGEMVKAKLDPIQAVIDRYKKPGEAIPQVDPMLMHGLAKTIRTELDLATTAMEQALQRAVPKGEILFELNKVLREKLYDHVQMTRGRDIRPVARKYGMNAMVKGEAADLTTPKGFFESLFSSYTFPTRRAIAARIGETAGKQMANRLKSLHRGFKHALTAEEEALVTRPSLPHKPPPRATIAGSPEKPGPTYDYGIEEGPLAPEPPPGPTAVIRPYGGGPTPKGEVYWPEKTAPLERQSAFGERASPESSGKPGKPGEFFPGKQGIRQEVIGTDPVTGKPIKQVRNYRKQQQLFSLYQTPPPRWKPTERLTSTLKDLTDMRNEIVRYLARSGVKGAARQEYIADVKAIQAEITRRLAARKAGQ